MPKINITDVHPGDIMLIEDGAQAAVERTVSHIEPMRCAKAAAELGQVYRITFADGTDIQWENPRCWIVRQVYDA